METQTAQQGLADVQLSVDGTVGDAVITAWGQGDSAQQGIPWKVYRCLTTLPGTRNQQDSDVNWTGKTLLLRKGNRLGYPPCDMGTVAPAASLGCSKDGVKQGKGRLPRAQGTGHGARGTGHRAQGTGRALEILPGTPIAVAP